MSTTTVRTFIKDDHFCIECPYSERFVYKIKLLQGKWNRDDRVWTVDYRLAERVKKVLLEVFGTDGSDLTDTVSIRLTGTEWDDFSCMNQIGFCGRLVCERKNRDDDVTLGPGIVAVSLYYYHSGGSMKYPELALKGTPIFEVYDIPKSVYEKIKNREGVELITSVDHTQTKHALLEEKKKLEKRIIDIESELKKFEDAEKSTEDNAVKAS